MKPFKPLLACFSLALLITVPSKIFAHEEESQSVAGKIQLLISTNADSTASEKTYHFSDGQTNKLTELHFKNNKVPEEILNLKPGSEVKIKGKKAQDHILYESLESTEPIILNHEGSHGEEVYPLSAFSGAKKVLAVRVNFLDANSSCASESVIFDKVLNPALPLSNKNFFEKTSHNIMSLGGEVATVSVNLRVSDQTSCNYSNYEKVSRDALIAAGYNLSNYTHHMYVLPTIPGCPAGQAWINSPPTSWIYYCIDKTMAHELGHNFGLHHAGDFTNEYNDYSDTMGRAYREFNAPHKHQLGWIPTNKIIDITASGTYRVSPLNAAPANAAYPQIYRVHDSVNNYYYYLSYRDKSGDFDKDLSASYADRLNIIRYRGTGADITRFITAIGDGASDAIPNTSFTVKNNARTTSYIEMIVTNGGGGGGDTIAPSVSLTSPTNGSSFAAGSTVSASASASDNVGVTKVEFYVNNSLKCSDTTSPYSCSFLMPTGSSLPVKARAYDAAGNMKDSTIIYISESQVDSTPPSVSLTSPSNGAQFAAGSTVSASASASDNVGVTKVEFYVNNALKCSDTTSPYSCSFLMPTGSSLPLKARAYDAAGNMKDSTIIYISETQVDSTPPSVSLTSPSNGAEFAAGSSVLAAASASDNVGVTKVEFYVNNSLSCSDSTSPYSCSFIMPTGSSISVKAKAYDAAGNMKDSSISFISNPATTVDTTPPSISLTSPGNGGTFIAGSTVSAAASASDNVGVTKVEFFVNNSLQCSDSTAPYSCSFSMPTGSNISVRARAHDAAGNMKDSSTSYISNPTSTVDTTPPSVPQGLSLEIKKRSDVNLSFSPSTDNVKMSHYEILRNSVVIGQSYSPSFNDPKVPGGSYTYQVRAVDAAGNKSALSAGVPVEISGKGQDSGTGKGKND